MSTSGSSFSPIPVHAANPGPLTGAGNWTYLLVEPRGSALLIDGGTGSPQHLQQLSAALGDAQATLTRLLVTHGHSDHIGGAAMLASAYPDMRCAKYPWPAEDGRWPVAFQPLRDGQRIEAGAHTLTVRHTPGHSPDHVVFWNEPSGSIFTGDLIVPGSSVVIPTRRGGDLHQYMASLELLLAMEPRRLYPAHGNPVDNPRAMVTTAINHRLERERNVLAALAAGHRTIAAIAESIYHGLPPELMGPAQDNVRAHLLKLEAEGRATGVQDLRE